MSEPAGKRVFTQPSFAGLIIFMLLVMRLNNHFPSTLTTSASYTPVIQCGSASLVSSAGMVAGSHKYQIKVAELPSSARSIFGEIMKCSDHQTFSPAMAFRKPTALSRPTQAPNPFASHTASSVNRGISISTSLP